MSRMNPDEPLTYQRCKALFALRRKTNKKAVEVKLNHNTFLGCTPPPLRDIGDDGCIYYVALRGNPILFFLPSGRIELNSCGYRTFTTKARMNAFLPVGNVYQVKGQWVYSHGHGEARTDWKFFDGMLIDTETGQVVNEPATA